MTKKFNREEYVKVEQPIKYCGFHIAAGWTAFSKFNLSVDCEVYERERV
jgi:hypothetical protein